LKTMNLKELLKEYKEVLENTSIDVPSDVNYLMMCRSSLIGRIKGLSDNQLIKFLRIDSKFTDIIKDIIKKNPELKDSINNKSVIVYYEIQTRRLMAQR